MVFGLGVSMMVRMGTTGKIGTFVGLDAVAFLGALVVVGTSIMAKFGAAVRLGATCMLVSTTRLGGLVTAGIGMRT